MLDVERRKSDEMDRQGEVSPKLPERLSPRKVLREGRPQALLPSLTGPFGAGDGCRGITVRPRQLEGRR